MTRTIPALSVEGKPFIPKGGNTMIWWIFALAAVTIISYLTDVGVLPFLKDIRVPLLDASIVSVLLLLCMLGILGRMLSMSRKGQKESLEKRIQELEKELSALKVK